MLIKDNLGPNESFDKSSSSHICHSKRKSRKKTPKCLSKQRDKILSPDTSNLLLTASPDSSVLGDTELEISKFQNIMRETCNKEETPPNDTHPIAKLANEHIISTLSDGSSPAKIRCNYYSSPAINSQSSLSNVSSSSFSPLAIQFNHHNPLILSQSHLLKSSPPKVLCKKKVETNEDPLNIRGNCTTEIDQSNEFDLSNLSTESNHNFWNIVAPDFNFLMGRDLIMQCQEADKDLGNNSSEDNNVKASFNDFLDVYLRVSDILNRYVDDLQNGSLISSNEIHRNLETGRKDLSQKAQLLQQRNPQLEKEISLKLANIESRWQALEKFLTQRDSYNNIPVLKDLREEIDGMKNWIDNVELTLNGMMDRISVNMEHCALNQLYFELKEFHSKQVVPQNTEIASIVFRCIKYNQYSESPPSTEQAPWQLSSLRKKRTGSPDSEYSLSSNEEDSSGEIKEADKNILKAAKHLETRWNKIRLLYVEVILVLEGAVVKGKNLKTNSPATFDTTFDPDSSKYQSYKNSRSPLLSDHKSTPCLLENFDDRSFIAPSRNRPNLSISHSQWNNNQSDRPHQLVTSLDYSSSDSSWNSDRLIHNTSSNNSQGEDIIPFSAEEYEKIQVNDSLDIGKVMPSPNRDGEKEYNLKARVISPLLLLSRTNYSDDTDDSNLIVTTTNTTTLVKNTHVSKFIHSYPYGSATVPRASRLSPQDTDFVEHYRRESETIYTEPPATTANRRRWDLTDNSNQYQQQQQPGTAVGYKNQNYLRSKMLDGHNNNYTNTDNNNKSVFGSRRQSYCKSPRFKNGYYNSYSMDIKPLYNGHYNTFAPLLTAPFKGVKDTYEYEKVDTSYVEEMVTEQKSRVPGLQNNQKLNLKSKPISSLSYDCLGGRQNYSSPIPSAIHKQNHYLSSAVQVPDFFESPQPSIRSNTVDILLDDYKNRRLGNRVIPGNNHVTSTPIHAIRSPSSQAMQERDHMMSPANTFSSYKSTSSCYVLDNNRKWYEPSLLTTIHPSMQFEDKKNSTSPSQLYWVDSHDYLPTNVNQINYNKPLSPCKGYYYQHPSPLSSKTSVDGLLSQPCLAGSNNNAPHDDVQRIKMRAKPKVKQTPTVRSQLRSGIGKQYRQLDSSTSPERMDTAAGRSTNEESMWDPYQAPLYPTDEEGVDILFESFHTPQHDAAPLLEDRFFESALDDSNFNINDSNGRITIPRDDTTYNFDVREFKGRKPDYCYGIDNTAYFRDNGRISFDTHRDCLVTHSIHNFCKKIKSKSKRSSSDSACYVTFDSENDIGELKSLLLISKKDLGRAIAAFYKFRSTTPKFLLSQSTESQTRQSGTSEKAGVTLAKYLEELGPDASNARMYDLSSLVNICRTHIYFLKTVIENIYPEDNSFADGNETPDHSKHSGLSFDSSLDHIPDIPLSKNANQPSKNEFKCLNLRDKHHTYLLYDKWQQVLYMVNTKLPESRFLPFYKHYLIDPEKNEGLEKLDKFSFAHSDNTKIDQNDFGKMISGSFNNTDLESINLLEPNILAPLNLTHRKIIKRKLLAPITPEISIKGRSTDQKSPKSSAITSTWKGPNYKRFWPIFGALLLLMSLAWMYFYLNTPYCCDNKNNFKRSFNFVLNYPHGPPPK